LDTPGIHKPKHKLGEYMVAVASETIRNADLVLWLVDLNFSPTEEDQAIALLLQELHSHEPLPPLLLGLNQSDRWSSNAALTTERIDKYRHLLGWYQRPAAPEQPVTALTFSAKTGDGIDQLLATIRQQLPLGPRYYPEDQVTDMQTRFVVAELIREQALHLLDQEVPHGIAVEVDEFTERNEKMTYISAVIYVERQSQKPIVLGDGGRMIKAIGQAARPDIEEVVGTRVYLELWVKVWEKWRTRSGMLRQLGYAIEK
jgi:GTP-binding protein Era